MRFARWSHLCSCGPTWSCTSRRSRRPPRLLPEATTLHLLTSAAAALARAYDLACPREACGFLLGQHRGTRIVASESVIAGGSSSDCDGFEIPDHELSRVRAYAEDRGLRVVALFHSHPSGDRSLSAADLAALRHSAWPWVIVTRTCGTSALIVTCYALGDGRKIAVSMEIRSNS